ncbi:MAG: magnesium transporter CorA family protein [Candidatus Paceibacterota bacterium]
MKEILINKGIKWIDITSPTSTDIQFLRKNFDFHPIILDELHHLSERSKVENYDGYVYLVIHMPNYDSSSRSATEAEVDILATKDAFITIHYEDLEPLEEFEKLLLKKTLRSHINNTGQLVYYFLGEVDKFSLRELTHIEEKVKKIGKDLFKGKEREQLEEISHIKRDLAALGIITWPERNILESLINSGTHFWGEKMRIYFNDALGDHWRVIHTLNNLKETLAAFEQTNSQLLDFKTNEAMKILTIVAFLTLPLTLFVSVLQVNMVSDFFSNRPFVVWTFLGLTVVASLILIIYFKKRKWL